MAPFNTKGFFLQNGSFSRKNKSINKIKSGNKKYVNTTEKSKFKLEVYSHCKKFKRKRTKSLLRGKYK